MNEVTDTLVDRCSLGNDSRHKRRGHRFFSISHLPSHRTMNVFYKRRFIKRICLGTLIVAFICVFLVFVIVPFVYRYSYSMQRNILFLNFVNMPNVNYKKPNSLGLVGARNIRISSKDEAQLGVWHMLPVKHQLEAVGYNWLTSSQEAEEQYDRWMSGETTIVYCHGNAGTRASDHRVRLYQLLNQLNYHVIAFDYRGYADSSNLETNEQGVVEDTKAVISWVRQRVTRGHVFVWGHSLGTAIASHALAEMEAEGKKVSAVVLEAPFNNLGEEISEYPISQLFKPLPWFDFCFVEPMYENHLRFESDKNLLNVTVPVLFLHAEDDHVVPYKLGRKLYQALVSHRKDDKSVEFVSFEASLRHGHKFIYRDKRLPGIVRNFVDQNLKQNGTTL